MFKVAIDCFHFVGLKGGSGGAGTYVTDLVTHLARLTPVEVVVSPDNARLFSAAAHQVPDLSMIVGERGAHADALRRVAERVDVLYAPFTGLPERETYARLRCVSAIHDIQHRMLSGFFGAEERLIRDAEYATAARMADGILTFSQAERQRIIEAYSPDAPVSVVPHAPFNAEQKAGESVSGASFTEKYGRYILYPAVNWPHKNHFRLLEAMRQLGDRRSLSDLRLVLTGASCVEQRDHVYRDLMSFPDLRHRIVDLGFVTSRQLLGLMRGAQALVFPSLFEGFGIPVLEAMRAGTPVIASNLAVFQEWFGGGFVPLTDPLSPTTMADEIAAALEDAPTLKTVATTGHQLSLAFTSERMASETLAVLRQVRAAPPVVIRSREAPSSTEWQRPSHDLMVHVDVPWGAVEAVATAAAAVKAGGNLRRTHLHLMVAEEGRPSLDARTTCLATLRESGAVSFYDPSNGRHRNLTARFNVTNYETAPFHLFLSADEFVALARDPAKAIARLSPRLLRPGAADGYYFGETPCPEVRRNLFQRLQSDPAVFETSLESNPALRTGLFAVATSAFGLLGGDPFSPGAAASLFASGRIMAPKRRFAYVEPELIGYVGHHFGLTRMVCHAAEAAGFECVVGTNRAWSAQLDGIEGPIRAEPAFSSFKDGSQPHVVPSVFAQELLAFMRKMALNDRDVVYLHMPYPTLMVGILELVATLPLNTLPTFSIRICMDDGGFGGHGIRQTSVIRSIRKLGPARRSRFRFTVESAVLQSYFAEKTGEIFPIVLNPSSIDLARAKILATRRRQDRAADAPVVFGYFGEAREEKGFVLVPEIIEVLVRRHGPKAVRFAIQVSAASDNDTPRVRAAREKILALQEETRSDGTIVLYGKFDTMAGYYTAMSECDAMLLPYEKRSYAIRGSGVVLEAMRLGMPVVVTAGTDMATTFAGSACVAAEMTVQAFAHACSTLLDDRDHLVERTEAFVKTSPLFMSNAAFVASVVERNVEAAEEAPVVLWIGNDVLSQGVSAVYKAQRAFFERQGYEIFDLYVPYPDDSGFLHSDDALEGYLVKNAVGWRVNGYDFDCYSWITNQEPSDERVKLLRTIAEQGTSTALLTELNTYVRVPASVIRLIANRRIDYVCLNYVHLLPVAERLGLIGRPDTRVILETHDIQAYQHAIRAGRKVDMEDVESELAAMKVADRIVAISRSDHKEISEFDRSYEVHFALPPTGVDRSFDGWTPGAFRLGRADLETWRSRSDLQEAFDLRSPESLAKFRTWGILYGHWVDGEIAANARAYLESLPDDHSDLALGPAATDVPRFLSYVWGKRADVRAAYPEARDVRHPHRAALVEWLAEYGSVEHNVSRRGEIPVPSNVVPTRQSEIVETILLGRPNKLMEPEFAKRLDDWLERHSRIDVLLVGSDHPSNVASAQWFLRDVFQPRLHARKVGLVIVGRICNPLANDVNATGALLLHEVEDLEPFYRSTAIVAAPVIVGTGTPIKVLDALAYGCCATVSRFIDRALDLSAYGFPLCTLAEDFSDDILRLLASPEAREERKALARRFAAEHLTTEAYDREWKQLVRPKDGDGAVRDSART